MIVLVSHSSVPVMSPGYEAMTPCFVLCTRWNDERMCVCMSRELSKWADRGEKVWGDPTSCVSVSHHQWPKNVGERYMRLKLPQNIRHVSYFQTNTTRSLLQFINECMVYLRKINWEIIVSQPGFRLDFLSVRPSHSPNSITPGITTLSPSS